METDIRQKIIDTVSIIEIYPHRLKNRRGNCTQHDNTSSPSFLLYPHDKTWCCFSCGTGGDVINLYAHLNNLSYREALVELAKEHKIEVTEEETKFLKGLDKIRECHEYFTDICHENLKLGIYYDQVKEKRGFTDNIINQYRIGLFDDSVKKLLKKKYNNAVLQYAGILSKKVKWYFGNRIVYPYLNKQKKPVYFIFRKIDNDPDFMDAKYIKLIKTEYIKEELFGIDSTAKFQNKPLIITEGITDAISTIQCGYPCLSPVTTRFKEDDCKKILNYAKHYKQIIIINDNETNQSGLKGAEKTLTFLLKHGIDTRICEIHNPNNLPKIDLNDFLKIEGIHGLQHLIRISKNGYDYFLDTLDSNNEEEIKLILSLIPEGRVILKTRIINTLQKKTKVGKRDLNALYKDILLVEKERIEHENLGDVDFFDERPNPLLEPLEEIIDQVEFNNTVIVNKESGLFIKSITDGIMDKRLVLEHGLRLTKRMVYLEHEIFSYTFNDQTYNTQTWNVMVAELEPYIYEGNKGRDAIKKIVNHMGSKMEAKECKTILGFDNGWVLPQLEIVGDYSILLNTAIQKIVYRKVKTVIGSYSDKEKEGIKKKLKRFVEITDIKKNKLAVIVGWSMASVFKLPILEYLNLFPGLLCVGDKQSGKTYGCKFFVVDFFKAWDNYLSGDSIKSPARCEDILSTSTFPILVDELQFVKYAIIGIFKSTLTGVHDYMRKTDVINVISKPEVAPFCITTNTAPKPFLDPALNSKILLLNFTAEEIINTNREWVDLNKELGELNLFSFLYEFTKDWTNEDVAKNLKGIENVTDVFMNKSRLRLKYVVVMFGLWLFANMFDIHLYKDLDLNLFEYSERIITESLLDNFLAFCRSAVNYDEGTTSQSGVHIRGNNPKYLQCKLQENNRGNYIFTSHNLRDFNEFIRAIENRTYEMKALGNLLHDSIKDETGIKYGGYSLFGKKWLGIRIQKKLID